ncbi:glycosidase [Knoellia aerolata]|uniref:Glycosidase n=1 Tax=Knoellia aerolata DSM 18566 TaxID=1385519 RepID=A0A0A0JY62_9MICO|nr:glycosidase [Knoellia aerolata]KGN41669.1 glycosidase [Knoellia aerolata DSM 18566]
MPESWRPGEQRVFRRAVGNPLLTADDWPYPVNAVFNPAAAHDDGETVLVCRVEDFEGHSHLSVARSADGLSGWTIEPEPLVHASHDHPAEMWGVEDPRVTRVDELGAWVIAYTAYGPTGPAVALATTKDFRTVERIGVVCPPEDKNAALLPRRIDDHYVLFHRPRTVMGNHADIWMSRSTDLRSWLAPEPVFRARAGMWDSARIGMGPPPIETPAGWLVAYHGVRETVAGQLYRVGLALLDLEDPRVVLKRSREWFLGPVKPYELQGDVPGVVFPCGWLHDPFTDTLRLYYGGADSVIAMAESTLSEVLDLLSRSE